MNDLTLGRTKIVGMYDADINLDGHWFYEVGYSYEEAINNLLAKIVWYFHGK